EAEVFPVEAQIRAVAPRSSALETATVMPRSLNEPVGFKPSYLTKTRAPIRSESFGVSISGVEPSPSVTTGVAWPTGRYSRYRAIPPLPLDFFDSFCIRRQR